MEHQVLTAPPRRKSVLIVDDEQALCNVLAEVFQQRGFEARCCFNGREALDVLELNAQQPDVILLDLSMPQLNGYEFLKAFRKDNQRTKVVIITGHPEDLGEVTAHPELLVADYFEKPFTLKRVLEKVEELTS
jgi:DNA-binding response OmpR family regulator